MAKTKRIEKNQIVDFTAKVKAKVELKEKKHNNNKLRNINVHGKVKDQNSTNGPLAEGENKLNSATQKLSRSKLKKLKLKAKKKIKQEMSKTSGQKIVNEGAVVKNCPAVQEVSTNNPENKVTDLISASNAESVEGNSKRKKKKKVFKKKISGSSNWALLCSELHTDPYSRKRAVSKIEDDEKNQEPDIKIPKLDVWFDNVDEALLEKPSSHQNNDTTHSDNNKSLVKEQSFTGPTKCIGMDCEMVGVGKDGQESILARVSLVNIYGHCLYDKYVLPREKVTDYRTHVSGVTKQLVDQKGEPFLKVQKEVSDLLQGRTLVGHALQNDLKVLYLSHPHKNIRDTSVYKPFRQLLKGRPSLKKLTSQILGVTVQEGEHSSVEDAQAAMRLYTMHRNKWEKELKDLYRKKKKVDNKKKKKSKS